MTLCRLCICDLQLVDTTATGQMNFHSFCQILGIMSRSTLQERLKLLYILHLDDLSSADEGTVIDYGKLRAGQENGKLDRYPRIPPFNWGYLSNQGFITW